MQRKLCQDLQLHISQNRKKGGCRGHHTGCLPDCFPEGDAFLLHEKPVAFLYTTARNLVLEYYKQDKYTLVQEAEPERSDIIAFEREPYEELCRQRSNSINEEACRKQVLRKLKPKERDLYRKYYIDKKPMKTIAGEFHMSETAVRMKYMRIRRKVQKIVAGMNLDDF